MAFIALHPCFLVQGFAWHALLYLPSLEPLLCLRSSGLAPEHEADPVAIRLPGSGTVGVKSHRALGGCSRRKCRADSAGSTGSPPGDPALPCRGRARQPGSRFGVSFPRTAPPGPGPACLLPSCGLGGAKGSPPPCPLLCPPGVASSKNPLLKKHIMYITDVVWEK